MCRDNYTLFIIKAAAVLLLTLLTGIGCDQRITPMTMGNERQILFLGNSTEPNDLDPHLVTGVVEHRILSALFEGLVAPDPITLEPVPGVAERWSVSDDGLTYMFFLRETARWSNGDPVTAHDFVFSYQRILSPKLAAEYAYMLYVLKNAQAYHRGTIEDFSFVGVKALDTHTSSSAASPFCVPSLPGWLPMPPTAKTSNSVPPRLRCNTG